MRWTLTATAPRAWSSPRTRSAASPITSPNTAGAREGAWSRPRWRLPGHQAERLRASLKPALSIEQLADEGFIDVSGLPASTNASVFALPGDSEREHWFGLHNFYVISRYNPSAMYAMAVHQLAERLGEQLAERLGEQLGDEAGHADAQ